MKTPTRWKLDGQILADLMERTGVNVTRLGEAIGVSAGNISAYMSNRVSPGIDTLISMADFFGVPMDYLMGRCDEETAKAILDNYNENFMKLRRRAYEDGYDITQYTRIQPDGRYEAPYPYNLVDAIFGEPTEFWITPDREAAIESVLKTLTEREQSMIDLIYRQNMTLEQAGAASGVTRERVRQIAAKALRKLRHPSRTRLIRNGETIEQQTRVAESNLSAINMEIQEKQSVLVALREVLEKSQTAISMLNACLGTVDTPDDKSPVFYNLLSTVEEMDLSVRSYNCLKRAGFNNVKDIIDFVKRNGMDEFYAIRNLGRKSVDEITNVIRTRYGIDLKAVQYASELLD